MAAPALSPYMAQVKRLDAQFVFTSKTPILDTLNALVRAIENRFIGLDELHTALSEIIDSIEATALARLDESFTPLIEAAAARLEQFGAAFNANSTTPLTLGTGTKFLTINEDQRQSFVFGAYALLRHTNGTESMIGEVRSYDREIGQLEVQIESVSGTGTFNAWDVMFTAPPNLAHEARIDNPHAVTAAQAGAYSKAESDSLRSELAGSLGAQIANLQAQMLAMQAQVNNLTVTASAVNRWIG